MSNTYVIGATVKMTATFRNASDELADPTTVTCIIQMPDNVETTYTYDQDTVTKDSTGVYSKTITVTQGGTYQFYFRGTGTVATAARDYFLVLSEFA